MPGIPNLPHAEVLREAEPRSTQYLCPKLYSFLERPMAYENILVERRGKVGLDHPQPAEGAERAVEGPRRRPERRAGEIRERMRRSARSSSPARKKPSAPAPIIKEVAGLDFVTAYRDDHDRRMGPRRGVPQAADRRRRRLCARRRLRARHDVRHHPRRRHREVRPAGDHARHHPRRRRHAAPRPPRR